MPCETIKRRMGDRDWSVVQMNPTDALDLETRLLPVLAQAMVPVIGAMGKSDVSQTDAIATAMRAMVAAIPPAELAQIIRGLCEQCFVDGTRVVFDSDFTGGAGVMLRYKVAMFVLEANFSDFLDEMLPDGAVEAARARFAATMNPSPG